MSARIIRSIDGAHRCYRILRTVPSLTVRRQGAEQKPSNHSGIHTVFISQRPFEKLFPPPQTPPPQGGRGLAGPLFSLPSSWGKGRGWGGKGGRTTSQTASEFRRDTQVNQDRGNRLSTFTGSARGLTSYLVPNHKIPSPVLVMALASRRGRWCGSLASRSSECISTCRTRESYHREQGRFRAGRRFGCCGPIQTHSPHPA